MRALRLPLLLTASLASLATSSAPQPWLGDGYVALHNGSGWPLQVRVDTTFPVELDCALLAELPELLAHVPVVGGPTTTLEPMALQILADDANSSPTGCGVARLEVEGIGARRVFWRNAGSYLTGYPPEAVDPGDVLGPLISVDPDLFEPFRDGRDTLVFPDEPAPVCAEETPELGWDGPTGALKVVRRGLDEGGCPSFKVLDPDGFEDVLTLCVPPSFAPFPEGAGLDVVSDGTYLRVVDLDTGVTLRMAEGEERPWGLAFDAEIGLTGCVLPDPMRLDYQPGVSLDGAPLGPGEIREILLDGAPARVVVAPSVRAVAPTDPDARPILRAALFTE